MYDILEDNMLVNKGTWCKYS